jgi:transcriptional regulator with XRE-family HTH domain
MSKTIHRSEYRVLLKLLKQTREEAGVTQENCSAALGRSQSFMSDIERGVRRLDVMELRDLCAVIKTTLPEFVREFEQALPRRGKRS